MLAAVLAGAGPGAASAATCGSATGQPVSPGTSSSLGGVAVVSCQAWAVGDYSNGTARLTLIERWNGTKWRQVPSPSPGSAVNGLSSVAATSASDAWAVGDTGNSASHPRTLAEHWNGITWARVSTPNPGGSAGTPTLTGVAATSASNAWAVGVYNTGPRTPLLSLAEHWNGTKWALVPTQNPGTGSTVFNYVMSVAATSASNAWAVGMHSTSQEGTLTLIEHWNGTNWTQVPSPSPGGTLHIDWLLGVTATSATDAWAVGRTHSKTLIEHWNGTAWTQVPSPNPANSREPELTGVTAISASDAWAVGDYIAAVGGFPRETLIEHWNGTAWTQMPSPNPSSTGNLLGGVAANSPSNVWAVGAFNPGSQEQITRTLAFHCC